MSLKNVLERYVNRANSRVPSRTVTRWNGRPLELIVSESPMTADYSAISVAKLWKTQPHLRTVVDYIASNIAQLGVHVFKRAADGSRDRLREGKVCDLLSRPSRQSTLCEFLRALVTQMALYSEAYVWVADLGAGLEMRVVPNDWVGVEYDGFGTPTAYAFDTLSDSDPVTVPPEQVLFFPGWAPDDPSAITSPVDTLRLVLAEQASAAKFRAQLWSNQGRFGGYLYRPEGAPDWDDQARQRFYRMWKEFTSNHGSRAGDNPLLEDGMEYRRTGFSAQEEQWAEATKISLETVCQVYHVPPVMVGITDDANYSNVTAYQRQLYTSTLASWLVQIEQRLNSFLLPMIGEAGNVFVEFNVEAKLRGDFAEQYKILSTAVGAPILTRNEARRVLNYKPLAGGDEVITPLNVTEGGQASPQDGGEGRPEEPGTGPDQAAITMVLEKTMRRMDKTIPDRIRAGAADWWQQKRWETETLEDLQRLGVPVQKAKNIARVFTQQAQAYYRQEKKGSGCG